MHSAPDNPLRSHPLDDFPIEPIGSWDKFLERWEAAVTPEERIGLLHICFDVPGKRREPTIFCMRIADGHHQLGRDFPSPIDRAEGRSIGPFPNALGTETLYSARARARIVQKAWHMLCNRVFKEGIAMTPFIDWFIPELMDFFTPEPGRVNLPSRFNDFGRGPDEQHYERIAKAFALKFIAWCWRDVEARDDITKYRPKLLLMLHMLDSPEFLLSDLTPTSTKALIEMVELVRPLALLEPEVQWVQRKFPSYDYPILPFRSIRKAVGAGWRWANVYLVLKTRLDANPRSLAE